MVLPVVLALVLVLSCAYLFYQWYTGELAEPPSELSPASRPLDAPQAGASARIVGHRRAARTRAVSQPRGARRGQLRRGSALAVGTPARRGHG